MDSVLPASRGLADFGRLRTLLPGRVTLPGDDGWDPARRAWNLAVDQRPAAVVLPESAADVVAAVDFARASGLRVTAQGTGHNAWPLGELGDTLLVKTERMRDVHIDPVNRRARVGAGTLWGEVIEAAEPQGLTALAGSSPDVGVVGYTLGGGMPWLGRRFGAAADSVLAIEVVTADGRLLRADASSEPDLFWALRGGGGSFGIVTALEFTLYPVARLVAGDLFWPIERAGEVLGAWRAWTEGLPESVTSLGRLLRLPPIPEVPEPLRGRSFVVVEAAMLMDEAKAAALLRPLRALGPEVDTVGTIRPSGLPALHMDPPHPVPGSGDGMLLSGLPQAAIEALLEVAGPGTACPLLSVEVRHLGGAFDCPSADRGAFSLDAAFAVYGVGMVMDAAMGEAVSGAVESVLATLAPWRAGHSYLNFSERARGAERLYPPATYARLREVKRTYDPGDVIRSNHPIPSA